MNTDNLRVLILSPDGVHLHTFKEAQAHLKRTHPRLNPELKIEETSGDPRCGIVLDYDKDDPHTESGDRGARHSEPSKIGKRWKHPLESHTMVMVFDPTVDYQLGKALAAVEITFQERLRTLAGMK